MPFPFALSRIILLGGFTIEPWFNRSLTASFVVFIVITNIISSVLSVLAFREKTGGGTFHGQYTCQRTRNDTHILVFQVLTICFGILTLLTVIGCLCHQFASRDQEASNTRNLCLFGICGLLGFALAVSLTVHARQDGGMGICNDFANTGNPCVAGGVQLGMAYVSSAFGLIGFLISWIDKFPGAVKVMPRYPITKAPSSHFAAHAHDLDGNYTHPPVKVSCRSRNNSGWSDVPLHC
ncbi:hypothetical protein HD554DRAFT_1124144 [Boletus coccyginus]|nr:hypothetical protein HD554DRAFT_1124144 [Boletus coccyginus]